MEDERPYTLPPSYAMNGGDGPHSYAQNSSFMRGFVDATKETMSEEIVKNLDINQLLLSHPLIQFRVADFGCSSGPNTFAAAQIVLEAVTVKFKSDGLISQLPEFQVFFTDLASNDFNTLFASLPPERQYYTAGVPGSFHSILFPKHFLHFAYSYAALNWLSEVPKQVLDKKSPAWNKGRIYYKSTQKEVSEAYSSQFAKDLVSFLNARAQELVCGGLMALVIPGVPDITSFEMTAGFRFEILESCLLDMIKTGLVSEEMVDSFNLPVYFTKPKELEAVIKRNGCFSIERMDTFSNPRKHATISDVQIFTSHLRAVFDGVIEKHFGSKVTNCLFELFSKKLSEAANSSRLDIQTPSALFVFLKRVQLV